MVQIKEAFYLYLILLLWSLSSFIIGAAFTKALAVKHRTPLHRLFLAHFWGFTLIVTCYAIYKTEFNTIASGVLLLILYFILRHSKKGDKEENPQWFKATDLSWYSAVAALNLLYFVIALWQIQDFSGGLHYFWGDANFYSAVADYINYFGKESTHFYNWINVSEQKPDYFHFSDLWAAAIISSSTGTLYYKGLTLVIYPFLLTLFTLGFLALLRQKSKFTTFEFLFIFLAILFIAPLKISILSGFEVKDGDYSIFNISQLKAMIIASCLVYALLNYSYKSQDLRLFPLFISVFLYSTPLPTVIGGILIYLILEWIFRGKPDWYSILLSFGILLFFVLFYLIVNRPTEILPYIEIKGLIIEHYSKIENYGTLFISIIKVFLSKIIPLLPYFLLLYILRKKILATLSKAEGLKETLMVLLIISATGWLGGSMINFIVDGGQIFENYIQPLTKIFIVTSIWIFYHYCLGWRKWTVLSAFFTIGLIFNNPFLKKGLEINGEDYQQLAEKLVAKENYPRIGFITRKDFYEGADFFGRNPKTVTPMINMRRFMNGYWPVNLSVYDIKWDNVNPYQQAYIVNGVVGSPFYQYAFEKGYAENEIEKAQLDFISEINLEFLIIDQLHPWANNLPIPSQLIGQVDGYQVMKINR
ncbi:hypothetical protein [Algoriphagus resistens]|uniref:hypothetical protein n=1 Tax=Algoriphagus resistens TaxID=1750590 RepID=UPI0007167C46|nr:hypothetical protein [Algoriphagus resistens]